ncbi:MAG TPA: hypothetical protein VL294_05050 [Pseudolysinimonas sp.]|jgi:hypothetical protein|nr:hypothetical protein [Pseudolysinimonas sp.]
MIACANCSRALQPAWKYCIYCGTRAPETAAAPRSRPLPKRTPVPGFATVASAQTATGQTPIVPPPAPAPLSAAPAAEPVSSEWPESMGERPSLRSALAGTVVPPPTPPREDAPAPEGEPEPDVPLPDEDDEPLPEPSGLSIADLAAEPEHEDQDEDEHEDEALDDEGHEDETLDDELDAKVLGVDAIPADEPDEAPRRHVNTLAILALAIGILACPLAALFGHLALGQLKVSGERGVIPAWIAVVLGYVWLGFWIVFGVSFLATNG